MLLLAVTFATIFLISRASPVVPSSMTTFGSQNTRLTRTLAQSQLSVINSAATVFSGSSSSTSQPVTTHATTKKSPSASSKSTVQASKSYTDVKITSSFSPAAANNSASSRGTSKAILVPTITTVVPLGSTNPVTVPSTYINGGDWNTCEIGVRSEHNVFVYRGSLLRVLTFTGTAGYSQTVTAPTASSTTIIIGAIFGGGKIVIGAGGRIIAPLPTGISQVEEQSPDAEPDPIPDPDTATASNGYTSSLSRSSSPSESSQASSSSAASCPMFTATSCGEDCYGPGNPEDYAPDSDETENNALKSNGRRSIIHRLLRLQKRSNDRLIRGCDLPDDQAKVSTSTNGVSAYVSARTPHRHFAFASATGNGFDIVETHPVGKPLKDVNPRNKKLGGCRGNWLVKCYDTAPEAQAIVNRIDSVPNLDWINAQKQFIWTTDSRGRLEKSMRALGAFPHYMNANADAFRDTVRDIITILQAYETRRGKITRPPMSIQFYEYMVSETQDYGRRGRNLGINLAQEFSRKLDPNTPPDNTTYPV
ncbi:hypothetical protein C8J57DRAFT_1229578 [Mycena rebaudengoi]|nr:hypothetical protein C8J57DRAFT_1229578 [Mycena rebaudengoi]